MTQCEARFEDVQCWAKVEEHHPHRAFRWIEGRCVYTQWCEEDQCAVILGVAARGNGTLVVVNGVRVGR